LPATLAANRLGVTSITAFILSAATLLTVVSAVFPTGVAVSGVVAVPAAFLAVGLVLALWAPGYLAMARQINNAGAFYAYIAVGLNRPMGVSAAWVALASYNALQVGLYGAIGAAINPLLQQWFGWDVYWWAIALAAWAITAIFGLLNADLNGRVLVGLLLAEILLVLVLSGANLLSPADGGITFEALNVANLFEGGAAATIAIACLGYVGMEQGAVYAEEARNPRSTVVLATLTAIIATLFIYTLSTWSQTVAIGPDRLVATAREQGPEMYWILAESSFGPTAVSIFRVLFVTSIIAALISFHNACSRYTFALAREGVIPRFLAATGRRSNAPVAGSAVQTVIGLAVIVGYAVAGWDPLIHLFFWLGTSGGIGVLLLITCTSIAVVAFLRGEGWRATALPAVAALTLLAGSYLVLTHIDVLLGVPPDSALVTVVPAVFAGLAALGLVWGFFLQIARPHIYAGIGEGAKSVYATQPASSPDSAPIKEGARQ
jgi:amino acid transporter